MKKTALILMIITIASKLIGFGREIVLAYYYGASSISDSYIIAFTIPGVVFAFVGSGISNAYIPMYTKLETEIGVSKADDYTNNLVHILLIASVILVGLGLAFTEPLVQIFASGFEGETLRLAVRFTKVTLFGMFFTGLIYVFNAYLQIKGNYLIPALSGFPLNLIVVVAIIISSKGHIMVLAYGILASIMAQFIILIPSIMKTDFKYKLLLNFKDPEIKNMLYLALPVIIGVAVNDINVIVDRTIASRISIGGISSLNYAQRLNAFVQGTIVTSIGTAMYPLISKLVVNRDMKAVKKVISEAILGTTLLVLPCMIGAMTLSEPIIEVLFGRGAFDTKAVILTSKALFYYSIGMIGIGLRDIISRPFYAMQDTKTPMINASIGMIVNIILNLILAYYMGIAGLALATSISSLFIVILLLTSLRKKIGPFGAKQISISILKILFSSILMGVITKLGFNYLITALSLKIALLASIMIGGVSYFILIQFMKIQEIEVMVDFIMRLATSKNP
ncbi:murein biosynthesis integral membrane protein MurJ [Fundicoccus sp. Sow4_F4]|uniref:murein biosynthesis integral membrane protein MurJ n=1 Tax=Fundicoccus sp. Sow4_F4 TaxID=3438783 RepID=UPI003F8F13D7